MRFCNPPQFANFPWGLSTVLSFLLHFSLCLRKWVPPPFLWSWCHGWVGWGTKIFFDQFFKEGSSLVLAVALKLLHRNLLVSGRTARRGGVSAPLQAQGRDHPSLFCFVVGQHAVAG